MGIMLNPQGEPRDEQRALRNEDPAPFAGGTRSQPAKSRQLHLILPELQEELAAAGCSIVPRESRGDR